MILSRLLCYNLHRMKLYVIHHYKDRYPDLKGRALTDALIRDCLGEKQLIIERTEKGKPYLRCASGQPCEDRHISVSHSGDTFALLVSEVNAGLDIQYPRGIQADRIAARYFTAEEAARVAADPVKDSFFEIWTRREACSKYTGAGLEQVMNQDMAPAAESVSFMDIRLEDGCFCAVCTGTKEGEYSDEIQISYGE